MQDYEIIQVPTKKMIGISVKTTNGNNASAQDIPLLWDKFYQDRIIEAIPNKKSTDVFALYCDYEGDFTQPYTLIIGCEVNSISKISPHMVAKTIPTATYARFKAEGKFPDCLMSTWQSIWQSPLKRTYRYDFEHYGKNFNPQKPEVDIFIGIQK